MLDSYVHFLRRTLDHKVRIQFYRRKLHDLEDIDRIHRILRYRKYVPLDTIDKLHQHQNKNLQDKGGILFLDHWLQIRIYMKYILQHQQ